MNIRRRCWKSDCIQFTLAIFYIHSFRGYLAPHIPHPSMLIWKAENVPEYLFQNAIWEIAASI